MRIYNGSANRAIRIWKGASMVRITDKSFQYTTSFNTDLKKKFRKLEQDRRAVTARSAGPDAPGLDSVVSMVARRSLPKI